MLSLKTLAYFNNVLRIRSINVFIVLLILTPLKLLPIAGQHEIHSTVFYLYASAYLYKCKKTLINSVFLANSINIYYRRLLHL